MTKVFKDLDAHGINLLLGVVVERLLSIDVERPGGPKVLVVRGVWDVVAEHVFTPDDGGGFVGPAARRVGDGVAAPAQNKHGLTPGC